MPNDTRLVIWLAVPDVSTSVPSVNPWPLAHPSLRRCTSKQQDLMHSHNHNSTIHNNYSHSCAWRHDKSNKNCLQCTGPQPQLRTHYNTSVHHHASRIVHWQTINWLQPLLMYCTSKMDNSTTNNDNSPHLWISGVFGLGVVPFKFRATLHESLYWCSHFTVVGLLRYYSSILTASSIKCARFT